MTTYRIRIGEQLSERWRGYFGTLALSQVEAGGKTLSELTGTLDEAALHGVLNQLCDLNLHLVSVDTVEEVDA